MAEGWPAVGWPAVAVAAVCLELLAEEEVGPPGGIVLGPATVVPAAVCPEPPGGIVSGLPPTVTVVVLVSLGVVEGRPTTGARVCWVGVVLYSPGTVVGRVVPALGCPAEDWPPEGGIVTGCPPTTTPTVTCPATGCPPTTTPAVELPMGGIVAGCPPVVVAAVCRVELELLLAEVLGPPGGMVLGPDVVAPAGLDPAEADPAEADPAEADPPDPEPPGGMVDGLPPAVRPWAWAAAAATALTAPEERLSSRLPSVGQTSVEQGTPAGWR
jgi:hypothetical protein